MYDKGQHLKGVDLKLFEQVKAELVSVSQLASAFSVLIFVMPKSCVTVTCCSQSWLAAWSTP